MVECIHGMDEVRVRFSAGPFSEFLVNKENGAEKIRYFFAGPVTHPPAQEANVFLFINSHHIYLLMKKYF